MAKKRNLFSGTLSEKTRKSIEKQLAASRVRDIEAMKKTNEARKKRTVTKRLNKIRPYVGGATDGREAHDRYKAIMDNVRKEDRAEVRGMDYDDVFIAADGLIDDTTDYWTADEMENYIINYLSDQEF